MPLAYEDYFPAGGGDAGGAPYIPESVQLSSPYFNEGTVRGVAGHDHINPFIPRASVTIDAVAWHRADTSAANAYVGLFNSAGVLLTDCALDSNTDAGIHAVSTTPLTLDAGALYYIGLNQSAAVAGSHRFSVIESAQLYWVSRYGIMAHLGATGPGTVSKARASAAFPSTVDLTGYSNLTSNAALLLGVRVAA